MALILKYHPELSEAGIDEAGRGCLAGPVVAAAVILPDDFECEVLNDSKQLTHAQREKVRKIIIEKAIAWNVAFIGEKRIDSVNILQATFDAMHEAVNGLSVTPEFLCIDGNRFRKHSIPHLSIVKGDAKYMHIAAASVLAKTFRDDYMAKINDEYPQYGWKENKGYPTASHRQAIQEFGVTEYHRRSFQLLPPLTLF
ncbi:MAG: ribonuclease HII [Bacteroidia bacterium]|nr:ribonuclease HII [Bacteroidia bacterium]